MDYKELRESVKTNQNIDQEQRIILLGYIDYCEEENVNVERVNYLLRRISFELG